MKIKNTFIQGKLNKDVDERLIPKGQYPHAENVRVSNSDGSDVGAVENMKGNFKLTSLGLTNAQCIGAFSDTTRGKIYWFVTSDEKDLVLEYTQSTGVTDVILEESSPSAILNFSTDYLITGVVKVINDDFNDDLLLWTDDLNPPRCINIERARGYAVDGFVEEDINLIKKPPRYAPNTGLTFSATSEENNLENKFIAFAYRYKYLDGEYSALSSFTNYSFSPNPFDLDYQTLENNGMINSFNAVDVSFNTGSKRVTDIDLVFKESNSNTVYLIERYNKEKELWGDNTNQTIQFSNNKVYTALAEDELFRTYDNVPRKAKALDIIGSRIVFGNYVEKYNLVDLNGDDVNIDYAVSMVNTDLETGEVISKTIGTTFITVDDVSVPAVVISNGTLTVDLTGVDLVTGSRLVFLISLSDSVYSGNYENTFTFILNRDYTDANDLATDPSFVSFVEVIMTNNFTTQNKELETSSIEDIATDTTGFSLDSVTTNTFRIVAPYLTFTIDDTPGNPDDNDDPANLSEEYAAWTYDSETDIFFSNTSSDSSLKTNRDYEVGMIYMDGYGRSTTVLTSNNNNIYIPQEFSRSKNKLRVTIPTAQKPPAWADRYKMVVKHNRLEYQTIYATFFYEDGLYRWVRIDGANRNKIKEGETLIVKSDLDGPVDELIEVRVLEVSNKPSDFIDGNLNLEDIEIVEQEGLYAKIKPNGFNMSTSSASTLDYENYNKTNSGRPTVFLGTSVDISSGIILLDEGTLLGYKDEGTGNFVDIPLTGGSTVNIRLRGTERDGYDERYYKDFVVQDDYDNFMDWFLAEVKEYESGEDFGLLDSTNTTNTGSFTFRFQRNEVADGLDNSLWLVVESANNGTFFEAGRLYAKITIQLSEGVTIFETKPKENEQEVFYETAQTFDISGDYHEGNIQNQTDVDDGILELDFFNCFVQGNGAESYRYKDAFNIGENTQGEIVQANHLNIDLRPSAVDVEDYKEVRRRSDLTYSAVYNENSNINGLNEFNLSRANFKEDIDKKYGSIQKIYNRDTDLLVFQEDKVSRVLFGKDLLLNADGTSNISSIEDVLGQQVTSAGEFGISTHPEGFAIYGNTICFPDQKRGAYLKLGGEGVFEISNVGMRDYIRDAFIDNPDEVKLGGYDPFNDQYLFRIGGEVLVYDDKNKGWTSILTYSPEFMVGLNNRFYTFKEGELYIHDSDQVDRNTFYGVTYPSKISAMVNESPSDVKQLKAVSIEGNYPWNININSYLNDTSTPILSSLDEEDFTRKEGMWYTYARRNEEALHEDSKSMYGIGSVTDITGTTVTVNGYSSTLTEGDTVLLGSDLTVIGVVGSVTPNGSETVVELSSVAGLTNGDFIVGVKNARIEGGYLRGYTMKLDLSITQADKVELFALNSEVMKSFS